MAKSGKSLERLIASLEKVLCDTDNVVIESPKCLKDRITGRMREHDVILTISQSHHQVVVAIECRDRSRPITVNQVESFWKKCQDTGIDGGVMVSSRGFYNTAREKADFLGIRCLDIDEVESFDWILAQGMHVLRKKLLHHEWIFYPEKEGVANKTNMEVIDVEGNLLTQEILTRNALTQLTKFQPEPLTAIERDIITVKFPGDNLIVKNKETGESSPVKYVIAKLHYSVIDEFIPFRLVQYKDDSQNIAEAAVADFNAENISGKFMIVGKQEGEKKVVFVSALGGKK